MSMTLKIHTLFFLYKAETYQNYINIYYILLFDDIIKISRILLKVLRIYHNFSDYQKIRRKVIFFFEKKIHQLFQNFLKQKAKIILW